jgi:hypothetical protein
MLLTEVVESGFPFRHVSMTRWYTWDEDTRCLRALDGSRALITVPVDMAISRGWEIAAEWITEPGPSLLWA